MLKGHARRLIGNSVTYGLGALIQRFIGLILLPWYTRALDVEEYGVLALLSLLGAALGAVLSLGTGNSLGIIYFRASPGESRACVIWSGMALLTATGIVTTTLVWFFAPNLGLLIFQQTGREELIRWSVVGSALAAVCDPFLASLRMEQRAREYVLCTFGSALLTSGLSILLVLGRGMGTYGAVVAVTASQFFTLVFLVVAAMRRLPFRVNLSLWKPLIAIGFPGAFGTFAFMLIDYADRQMIERMLGLESLGIYSVGYNFGMVMCIPMGAFATAWPPFYMSFIDRLDEGKIVLARVLTIYTLSFGLLTALFFAAAVPVTRLMTAPPFQPAWCVVGLVAASYALKGVYLVFLPGLYIGKTPRLGRQTMIEWLAALLNVGLNFWLIPMWGLSGAAAATLVSYAALPALAWLASRDEFEVAWEWRRIGMAVTLLIPGCVGLYAASKLYDQGVALIPSLMVALPSLAVACCALSMISPDDRRRLAQAVRQ